jgi:NAD(P)-dependent dehydrogenase (short-subunit alcohol dehydrogenase family)
MMKKTWQQCTTAQALERARTGTIAQTLGKQDMNSLAEKRVVVTGGFGALGRAVSEVLMRHGARIALIDKAAAPAVLPAGVVALGGVDLGESEATNAAFRQAAAALGGLDGLVNVAGGFRWEPVATGSVQTWDAMYEMNLRTALLASQAALPHLLASGRGRIVNVGAYASQQAGLGLGAYAASKAGVSRLTEALAEELKDQGVTVNAVLPSILDTPANRADMPDADFSRWVQPAQLAEVIAFLLQDAAAAVTGALIPVRGRV